MLAGLPVKGLGSREWGHCSVVTLCPGSGFRPPALAMKA